MIRFQKGLGSHYRLALPRCASGSEVVSQATQDTLPEGFWGKVTILNGKAVYTLPGATAEPNCLPCVSNPLQPDHSGPFVPLAFAQGQVDLLFTDQFDSTNAASRALYVAGLPLVVRRYLTRTNYGTTNYTYGLVPVGYIAAASGSADPTGVGADASPTLTELVAAFTTLSEAAPNTFGAEPLRVLRELQCVVGKVIAAPYLNNGVYELAVQWNGGL